MNDGHASGRDERPSGSDTHLEGLEESVNRQIDVEVHVLLESFKEIIGLNQIADKDHFAVERDAFQAEGRADSMVRAAQSLYLLSDSLKLSLLLSQSQMSEARNHDAQQLLAETEKHKATCSRLLAERWLSGAGLGASSSAGTSAPGAAAPGSAQGNGDGEPSEAVPDTRSPGGMSLFSATDTSSPKAPPGT